MKIGLLGHKGTTLDLLQNVLLRKKFEFSHVFSIPENLAEKNNVAYYQGTAVAELCAQHSIPHTFTNSYNLSKDMGLFAENGIDFLVVIGWERILPDEILNSLTHGAAGMHGSAFGLPRGRGRSPMNWSIITAQTRFMTYLFRYTPGMDDGEVLGFRAFEINEHDTIGSLHAKNRVVMGQLLEEIIPQIERGTVKTVPQPETKPSYYPKRTKEDGRIDWNQSTSEIFALIRAVAPPYPGAISRLEGSDVAILGAAPFDRALFTSDIAPGTIVDVMYSQKQFVVKTKDGSLHVHACECENWGNIQPGKKFDDYDINVSLERIRGTYPDFVPDDEKEI